MIKEALQYLLELKRPETLMASGREYSTINLQAITEPTLEGIRVNNLSSLVTYLKEDPDKLILNKIINIEDSCKISVISSVFGEFRQREGYIIVDCKDLLPSIYFERFLPLEQLIIDLKSKFIKTEELEQIVKIIGNISEQNVTNYNDDGITQQVTSKTGIARVGDVALPPRIMLKPYRTFIEVEQPTSEFLLRARKVSCGLEFALFECDGGAWKKEAIKNIARYLKENLKGIKDITILN